MLRYFLCIIWQLWVKKIAVAIPTPETCVKEVPAYLGSILQRSINNEWHCILPNPKNMAQSYPPMNSGSDVYQSTKKQEVLISHLFPIDSKSSYCTYPEEVSAKRDLGPYPVTGCLFSVLDDHVILPKKLEEANYGRVRECKHRITRKTYACKTIDKSKIDGRLDHLQREINLLSTINHHGIMSTSLQRSI